MNEILSAARDRLGMSQVQLWTGYVGLGGLRTFDQVEAFLDGSSEPSSSDYDLLAQVLNDEVLDHGGYDTIPYFDELPSI